MSDAATICDQINLALPNLLPGSLRFWGVWFGRPYDGALRIVAADHDQDVLRLHFGNHERLTVWSPAGMQLDSSISGTNAASWVSRTAMNGSVLRISEGRSGLRINDAQRVLWEFFYAGRPQTDANRFFYDFVKTPPTIVGSSNVNWFTPDLNTDSTLPAVEIISLNFAIKRE